MHEVITRISSASVKGILRQARVPMTPSLMPYYVYPASSWPTHDGKREYFESMNAGGLDRWLNKLKMEKFKNAIS